MACSGILLTGGTSARMGTDKATLSVAADGATLAERAAAALLAVADPVIEVGPGVSGLESVRDDPPHQGPLVAIAAAVAILDTGAPALVLACDLPFVTDGLLRWLVEHPAPGSVVPRDGGDGRPQPLCARWSADALRTVPGLVGRGERSLRALVSYRDVTFVDPDEWLAAAGDAGLGALDDVDTPAEWDAAGRRLQ